MELVPKSVELERNLVPIKISELELDFSSNFNCGTWNGFSFQIFRNYNKTEFDWPETWSKNGQNEKFFKFRRKLLLEALKYA